VFVRPAIGPDSAGRRSRGPVEVGTITNAPSPPSLSPEAWSSQTDELQSRLAGVLRFNLFHSVFLRCLWKVEPSRYSIY
jgi:hypothetical protein